MTNGEKMLAVIHAISKLGDDREHLPFVRLR
jgi:hypothetical protein